VLIDVHGHIGRCGAPRLDRTMNADQLVALMDDWEIDKTCVLPLHDCPEGWYIESTTEHVLAACAKYPEQLIPFCLVDPRFGDNDASTDFGPLLAEYRAQGCVGLGELICNLYFDDPRCINLYRHCGKAGLPVLFDMKDAVPRSYAVADDPGLPRLEKALRLCPDTQFIGHGPAFWSDISGDSAEHVRNGYPTGPVAPGGAVPRLMTRYANLYADISAGSGYGALTRDPEFGVRFLEEHQDKLLFGIDNVDHTATQEQCPHVRFLNGLRAGGKITDGAYQKIAHLNAERLLGLT